MKFEVNKFLALTALLATATASAVGCSSTDAKQAPSTGGGEGGEAGSVEPSAGSGAVAAEGGAAGALAEAGQGGEAGTAEGGAGGAPTGMCIGEIVGQGGAAEEGTTPCDLWAAAGAPDCGNESGLNSAGEGCFELYNTGIYRPSVVDAYNTCATKLADTCDQNGVIDCANGLIGQGCAEDTTTEACALVARSCSTVTNCTGVMNLLTPEGQAAVADCMDPASENYVAYTADDCNVNLKYCANLPVPAPPAVP